MEPPSSITTDNSSKADPRSDDPLSCKVLTHRKDNSTMQKLPKAFVVIIRKGIDSAGGFLFS
jgi:hypothetical protein